MSELMNAGISLSPVGPVGTIDRSLELSRAVGWSGLVRAWSGGASVALVIIAIFYLEQVEGLTTLRLPCATLLVGAWCFRSWASSRVARDMTLRLFPFEARPEEGRPLTVLRTALVAGIGLWLWSWLLVAGLRAGIVGVLLAMAPLALRGWTAPAWTARSAYSARGGIGTFVAAARDNAGRRGAGVVVEGIILLAGLALALNLYAAFFACVLLLRSLIGLELASLTTFLGPSNAFVQLTFTALGFVLLEPVRAGIAASSYVGARVHTEGLDLQSALDIAMRGRRRAQPSPGGAMAASVALITVLAASGTVNAQNSTLDLPPPPDFPDVVAPSPPTLPLPAPPSPIAPLASPLDGADADTDRRIGEILSRPDFREFARHRGEGFRGLLARLLAWLLSMPEELPEFGALDPSALPLPGLGFFLGAAVALFFLVALLLWMTRRRAARAAPVATQSSTDGVEEDPRERSPAAWADVALRLAAEGKLRDAIRASYLATLVALDRRGQITFDPNRTNWHYSRALPPGEIRDAFVRLTRLFDHKWYGEEPATLEDFERARTLGRAVLEGGGRA